ncbi:glutamine amidotransferase [Martelella lutilitoris]|uniref:Glutamine amidotransferase n=1 Tax=Martelella lutilitoris TaxID=2583532 RepID=A0A7T7HLX8_9HYPH|nr:glutamine amidotransferase [Martelella lutilitoris]QQM31546.1 glutamine amidotransferase [Martelella lutilitoris]
MNDRKKPVLIILHQERSTPGRVGQLLMQKRFPLDIRRPALGDTLPSTLENHSGAVVFGGPMSANDNEDYVRREIDWLDVPLKEDRPFLGICLGAQMLARQLGAKVYGNHDGSVEIGWYPIEATNNGRMLMKWPSMVYQFHREGFELPRGAELLARGDLYPNQAYRYGKKAYGVQFHAELTRMMMQSWVVRGASRFTLPKAQPGSAHLEGRMLHDRALKAWLDNFLDIVFEEAG